MTTKQISVAQANRLQLTQGKLDKVLKALPGTVTAIAAKVGECTRTVRNRLDILVFQGRVHISNFVKNEYGQSTSMYSVGSISGGFRAEDIVSHAIRTQRTSIFCSGNSDYKLSPNIKVVGTNKTVWAK